MSEYQAAGRKTGGEARMEPRREISRRGTAAVEPKLQTATTKEQPSKRSRRTVAKRSRGSASQGEPNPKKSKIGSEAKALMPEVVPADAEE